MTLVIHTIYNICSLLSYSQLKDFGNVPNRYLFINHMTNMANTRGIHETILYYKIARMYVYRYLSGQPLLDKTKGMKITTDGIPVFLQDWIPLIRFQSHKPHIRILTSLLYIGRLYDSIGDLETETITGKYTGLAIDREDHNANLVSFMQLFSLSLYHCETNSEFGKTFLEGLERRLLKLPDNLKGEFYLRTTVGPMGPGLQSIVHEALLLSDKQIDSITYFIGEQTKSWFNEIFNDPFGFIDNHPTFKSKRMDNPTTRRITVVEDKEGKSRVIAILDYWTQLVLRPLHDFLASRLKNIPSDCTFDQTIKVEPFYKYNLEKGSTFHCLDLSAATDRMPIKLQHLVLAHVFNSWEVADKVMILLVDEPFQTKNGDIRYEVGQPMGAYCSWPLMALTHHYIVYLAAKSVDQTGFTNYLLLGDDIVICDNDVANEYRRLLKEFGMEISERKTMVSKDTMEFVKRLYHKGNNITPLAMAHLKYAQDHIGFGVDLLDENKARGYDILPNKFFEMLSNTFYPDRSRSKWWYYQRLLEYYNFPLNLIRRGVIENTSEIQPHHVKEWVGNKLYTCNTRQEALNDYLSSVKQVYLDYFKKETEHLKVELKDLLRGETDYYTQFNQNKGDGLILKIMETKLVDMSYEYEHIRSLIEDGDYDVLKERKEIGRSMRMSDSLNPSTHQKSILVKTLIYNKVKHNMLNLYR